MKRLVVAIVSLVALAACAPQPQPFTFAVAGDSLTAWDNHSFPTPDGDFSTVTWTHWAIGDEVQLAGGFAREDFTAQQIADSMVPVDADVLVVLAGTNDVGTNSPSEVTTQIIRLVEISGVDAVLISALPPVDDAAAFNSALEKLAADQGWSYVDPWASLRRDDGEWLDGSSNDGVHPTPASAKVVGAAMVEAMRRLVG